MAAIVNVVLRTDDPKATCVECHKGFLLKPVTRRVKRGTETYFIRRQFCTRRCIRKNMYRLEQAKGRYWEDTTEYCAICEGSFPTEEKLAGHMKQAHNRLITDSDINRADEARQAKLRAVQATEDELFEEPSVEASSLPLERFPSSCWPAIVNPRLQDAA